MNNLIICYPGGTGGHFITAICVFLLHKKPFDILLDGSVHSLKLPCQRKKFLNERILDLSPESYKQEYEVIQQFENFDIVLGHFRNLLAISQIGKKIIYITFEQDSKQIITNNLNRKTKNLFPMSEKNYKILAGSSWPSYVEYLKGAKIKELNTPNEDSKKYLDEWYYILPYNKSNLLEIKFENLYNSVDNIANFLNVSSYDQQYIEEKINEYKNKQ